MSFNMAKSDSRQSHFLDDVEALQYLPDVLSVLLDPTKQVIDDTCVEKLLSWLAQLAAKAVTLKNLLNERTDVIKFLQRSTCPSCIPSAMVFSLRLTAILLNSLTGLPVNSQKETVKQIDVMEGVSLDERAAIASQCLKHVDVISGLVEQLLINAHKKPYWHEASIRTAWFVSAKALICSRCSSEIIQRIGLVDIALQSLEDNCMFVVSATQQCLADVIATTHKCSIGDGHCVPQSIQHVDVQFSTDGDVAFTSDKGFQVLPSHQQASEVSESIVHVTYPQRSAMNSQESPSKRTKLDRINEDSLETDKRRSCDCELHLKTCLQKLTAILKPFEPLQPPSFGPTSSSQTTTRSVTIGVLVKLIESWPIIGHKVLAEMSLVLILSELIKSSSKKSYDICRATVELISVFLQTMDGGNDLECSDVTVLIDLPVKLMNIHQFSSAIQLASKLFSTQQRLEGNVFHSKLPCHDVSPCPSLLKMVILPLDCALNLSDSQTNKCTSLTANRDRLLEEMMANKCHCVALLCNSLSALERMVAEGLYHIMSQQTCLVDHVTSILSLTLGQTSHHVITASLRCHLRGSIKVTKAVLHLAMATVASSNQCDTKFPETSARNLLLQLTSVLNNPESDCTVVSKCLDVLALFLPIYAVILMDDTDTMTLLGQTVTKRSCDPRWEVRDSVMCFLQRLLQCPTDVLCVWFKRHNLHLRVMESTDDGEGFVKASALRTLVDVSKQRALWGDLLQQAGQTEYVFVGQFVDVMLADSQGFARRATVGMYTKWLMVLPWLQAGLPGNAHSQGHQRKLKEVKEDIAKGHDTNVSDNLSVATRIRSGISTAMFDLDWEVKLGALEFWKTLLEMYTPTRHHGTFPDTNKRELGHQEEFNKSEENYLCSDDQAMAMQNVMQLLKEEGLVGRLVKVLDDEDRAVAVKACQMLLSISTLLQSEKDVHPHPKIDHSDTVQFMKTTREKLVGMRLEAVLEEKLMVVDGYEQHPLSLLQDILAGTQEKDGNILDCY